MRLVIIRSGLLFCLLAIFLRLFYWQVFRSDDLTALAEEQHVVSYTTLADRGLILSSDGAILASNKPTYLLFFTPKAIQDKTETANKLADVLWEIDGQKSPEKIEKKTFKEFKKEIIDQLNQNLFWIPIRKNLTIEEKNQLANLKLSGMGFDEQTNRFYPEASSAAHILGFVGSNFVGDQIGYFGVEGYYNGELKGQSGRLKEEKDAIGLPILSGKFFQEEPEDGYTLTLTLDRTVQYLTEKKLKEGLIKYGAKAASAVVMDPQNGAILGMAAYPDYDPNNYSQFTKEAFKNPIVADAYEPGSTFKVLVMAAALNENLVTPETICDICGGPVEITDYVIRTWNNRYQADSKMTEVMIHSDNTGMVFVGRKLGLDKMYQYLEDFGFGQLTGVDLQDESSPSLRPQKDWREIDLATASFGQGIAVTPLQMIRAVSAIANGGILFEPHVLQSIQKDQQIIEIKPKIIGKPISPESARLATEMMVQAVEKGEAGKYAIPGFKIAGKTGTAQIPVAGHYDPDKTIASFVGFAPADHPKFVLLVRFDEPSTSIFGADTAAPTFFEITKELLLYYQIAPQSLKNGSVQAK